MKTGVIYLGSGLLMAAVTMAQGGDLAGCANTCVQNMQSLASALGCTSGDNACLCTKPDFTYGIRDCSYQSCNNTVEAEQAVAYGVNLCREAGVDVTATPKTTVTQATGTETVTASPIVSSIFSVVTSGGSTFTSFIGQTTLVPGGEGQTATPSAVTTSTFTTVITSGESTFTSVGETTIVGIDGVPGATSQPQTPVTTAPVVSTITSGNSVITSTVGSTTVLSSLTGSAASSALSSQASEASSASQTAQETASESQNPTESGQATSASASGFAPKQTAGSAAGILAAAGLAAMLI